MRLTTADIRLFSRYNKPQLALMAKTVRKEKTSLSEKLVAAWLKYDPFVKIIAQDNNQIRYDAMLAMAGEKAAKKFFNTAGKLKPSPKLVYPHHVRKKEREFLDSPQQRTRIIRQLVYWGRDEYLNKENPDSYKTRIQIIHSLLGVLFINSNSRQERLIIDGVKVLVISRPTSLGKQGEQSPLVHQEILNRVADLLRYNQLVIHGRAAQKTHAAMKAQLVKTIQSFRDSSHRAAYYLTDDKKKRQKVIQTKFPLKAETETGLLQIVKHYTFSGWPQFKHQAERLLNELGEKASLTPAPQKS